MEGRIVDIPKGGIIYRNGYVYVNISSQYDASVKYTRSVRKCVGKNVDGKTMCPNRIYDSLYGYVDAPTRSDVLSVGTHLLIQQVCKQIKLDESLLDAFPEDTAKQIKDMASFMLVTESDAFQHYPSYGFSNALFSQEVRSDSSLCRFLRQEFPPSRIRRFLDTWSQKHRGSGKAYLCYDSTNINFMAEGVELTQMGHAKDDPTKPQVNLEYVVRQEDGLPLLYKDYPGSITDVTEGSDMIDDIHALGYENITLVCDRGYISRENITLLDKNNLNFLIMLRMSSKISQELVMRHGKTIRLHSEYYLPERDAYAMTVSQDFYGSVRYFHIFWNHVDAERGRRNIMNEVERMEIELAQIRTKSGRLNAGQIRAFSQWFALDVEQDSGALCSYQRDYQKIDNAVDEEGFFILLSSERLSCTEAADAYSKRDCVEKTFRALKSSLGMDTIRAHSDETAQSRLFLAFIASIIRSVIFFGLKTLRLEDRKNFTVPAAIKELANVEVLRDDKTLKYFRRYKLTAKQKKTLAAFSLQESDVDALASSLSP